MRERWQAMNTMESVLHESEMEQYRLVKDSIGQSRSQRGRGHCLSRISCRFADVCHFVQIGSTRFDSHRLIRESISTHESSTTDHHSFFTHYLSLASSPFLRQYSRINRICNPNRQYSSHCSSTNRRISTGISCYRSTS